MNWLVTPLNLSYLPLMAFDGNFKILAHLKIYASLFEGWECGIYTVNIDSRDIRSNIRYKEKLATEVVKEFHHEV